MKPSARGCGSARTTAECSPKWWAWAPRVVAEELRPLIDPLPGLLVPGPAASPDAVARAISATLAPPRAPDAAPSWLDPPQAEAFGILLHALRQHDAVLCADPIGSGKTYIALGIADAHDDTPAVCIVPPALQDQWQATARRLGVDVVVWSHAQLSRGRLPTGAPSLVIVDESHHFRHPTIRRYRTLAPWLVGRRVLLLSATPIVNRPVDLYHQLHLGLRDDALVDDGAVSLRASFDRDAVAPALGRFVVQRNATAVIPRRRDRSEVLQSGAVPLLPILDTLGLSTHPDVAALARTVLLHAAASSPAALLTTLQRYCHLLLQARDAIATGMPPDRQGLRRIIGSFPEQLVMWSLFPAAGGSGELVLDDLPAVEDLLVAARQVADRPDQKAVRLSQILAEAVPTLVYVTARATIAYLRRHLPDRWLAWCSGERSGVGRTTLSREEVLRWFRPDAPSHPPGVPGRPCTLLTTDVTAEGLDLQGAGRVVHYDLPWTEVRLAQRDGRAIRRGSRQMAVDVIRFLPDRALEHRLHQVRCLTRKSALPAEYGLGSDGRARWRWRGEVADAVAGPGVEGTSAVRSTVEGAVAGVVLEREGRAAVSAVLVRVSQSRWVTDAEEIRRRLGEAVHGMPLSPPSRAELEECLITLAPAVRLLLRDASLARVGGMPARATALALGKRLRRMAATAARRRDAALLGLIEDGLKFCTRGHTAGEAMLLESLSTCSDANLVARLAALPPGPPPGARLRPRLTGLIVFRHAGLSSF